MKVYNNLNEYEGAINPVVTIGIGKVMSAGVLLLAAGDKGNRFITENTRVMVHEISSGTFGAISEMESSVAETRRMQDLYIELLAKDSNTNKTKLLKDMEKETYMSAKETVSYGIADQLVPTRSLTRKVTKKKKTPVKKTKKKKKVAKKLTKRK